MSEGGITVKDRKISFGNIPVSDLGKKYSTPLLVFSEQRIIDNFKAFSKAFKKNYKNSQIYFSVKTNFETQVLKTLVKLGSNAEVASSLEVKLAQKAGFKPEQIVLDGPAWTDNDMEYCIDQGIHTFNVDSVDMLHRLHKIAKKKKKTVRIGFRVYPEVKMSILKTFVENFISKFGVPISKALDAYKEAQQLDYIEITSMHAHIGSMITDPSYYEKAIAAMVKLAGDIKEQLGIELKDINIGGGYGVQSLNYFSIQNIILSKAGISTYKKAASIDEFATRITNAFKKSQEIAGLKNLNLVLEPGRFIVSDAGILITKIVSVKPKWIFLDGGINIVPESLFFIRRGFMVDGKVGLPKDKKYGVAGPTLSTPDILADAQEFQDVEVGDTVVVLDAGAYTLPRSTQFTMLRPNAMYVTKDKKVKYLRKAEKHEDFMKNLL